MLGQGLGEDFAQFLQRLGRQFFDEQFNEMTASTR